MAFETATFNPKEFELRNFTNPYLSPEQTSDVALVESRVNGQLDFLAQMLGWNGPNYWGNLPDTPDQKRQLLGGSFGVYNGFFIPRIYEVRNWDNTIVVDRLPFVRPGQQVYVEKIILGDDVYSIKSLSVEGDYYIVGFGTLPQSFYDQIAANVQLKVLIPTLRPAPFYRGEVGFSGDAAFVVSSDGTDLRLYPFYDTQRKFQYLSLSLFADSVYYFDQPVYLKYNLANTDPDVYPEYDAALELWYLRVPKSTVGNTPAITSFLCWDYADSSTLTTVSTSVAVLSWRDNSDWGSLNVIENFTGVWGNKGGPLPFNLAFDSLSIHGVSEENSLLVPAVERSLSYNTLMEEVYSQLTSYDITAPGKPKPGDLWWNPETGALSVWYAPENQTCAFWVEIDYRQQPSDPIVATLVYPDVTSFTTAAPTIALGTTVQILDANGLNTGMGIIGLTGAITTTPSLYLYNVEINGVVYWQTYQFTFANASDFNTDSAVLPTQVPCVIANALGLDQSLPPLQIRNLDFQINQPVPAVLTKVFTDNTWIISPDSILKYISQSSLFGYELQGEMWWDYGNPVYETRAASIYIQSAWVSVNYHPLSAAPTYFFNSEALQFYCDGTLLLPGEDYTTGDYTVRYTYNPGTQNYDFVYTPITLIGSTQLPLLEVSDSTEGTYRLDISQTIFGGMIYRLTPSVADCETPLRLWKTQDLQDVGTLAHLAEDNYINPLVADQNNGPGLANWEKYFVRLPLDYGRNEAKWQKTTLICQDFAYWGSSVEAERMECPPEDDTPVIYEELCLYGGLPQDYSYVYTEPYLYSNIAYLNVFETADYLNAGVFPGNEIPFDGFDEGTLTVYDPLHSRQADVTAEVGFGYGDWEGVYTNVNACKALSGFFVNDVEDGALDPIAAPIWDASIYKLAPTCENDPESYSVDANHYKIGYAYFVADASAAEDGFFDPQQPSAWREPYDSGLNRTLYLLPR